MTDESILLFGLENAIAPSEVDRLLELLGEAAYAADLTTLPTSEWVLAAARGPLERARFAVSRCEDAVTLGTIARTERRMGVIRSLVLNEHLAEPDFRTLRMRLTARGLADGELAELDAMRLRAAPTLTTESLTASLDDLESFRALVVARRRDRVLDDLSRAELAHLVPEGQVERFLDAALKFSDAPVITQFLRAYYGLAPNAALTALYRARRSAPLPTPSRVVGDCPADLRAEVLTALASNLATANSLPHPPIALLDEALAHEMLADAHPPTIDETAGRLPGLGTYEFATPAALDAILDDPAWIALIERAVIDDEQFAHAIRAQLPVTTLLRMIHGRQRRVELLVRSGVRLDYRGFTEALSAIVDVDDPLIEDLVECSEAMVVVCYLCGALALHGRPLLCRPSRIPHHLGRLPADGSAIQSLTSLIIQTISSWGPSMASSPTLNEYLRSLLSYVPGLARACAIASRPSAIRPARTYVYERLIATGASPAVLLDQLGRASNASLDDLCATLRRLAD